jgi:hypothetical protein
MTSYRDRRAQELRQEGHSEGYVAGWLAWHDGFDPHSALVGEDGLEYEDLAALIAGRPIPCARNEVIQTLRAHPHPGSWEEKVAWQYDYQSRDGHHRAHGGRWTYPQLPVRFSQYIAAYPGGPEGAGRAGVGEAPADPVHAADQPPV